jgi:hypothetical protein
MPFAQIKILAPLLTTFGIIQTKWCHIGGSFSLSSSKILPFDCVALHIAETKLFETFITALVRPLPHTADNQEATGICILNVGK